MMTHSLILYVVFIHFKVLLHAVILIFYSNLYILPHFLQLCSSLCIWVVCVYTQAHLRHTRVKLT